MKILIVAILICFPSALWAFDEWDKTEIGMEAAYIGLAVVDWGQTLDIARNDAYHENNPVIGERPSRRRVNSIFAFGMIAQPIIAHVLPHKWRKAWIASGVVLEAYCINNNHNIGLRVTF